MKSEEFPARVFVPLYLDLYYFTKFKEKCDRRGIKVFDAIRDLVRREVDEPE